MGKVMLMVAEIAAQVVSWRFACCFCCLPCDHCLHSNVFLLSSVYLALCIFIAVQVFVKLSLSRSL